MVTGENKKLQLIERIRSIANWIKRDCPNIQLEELINEAFLLCFDYAKDRGKRLNDLSATEIRNKCFEALRKILPPEKVFPLIEEIQYIIPDLQILDPLQELEKKEEVRKAKTVEWILQFHPTLSLTDRQWAVYQEFIRNIDTSKRNKWRADYARKVGTTRQNIWNIENLIKRRISFAKDLLKLWEGDIHDFFSKYAKSWKAPMIRKGVWPVVSENTGPPEMRKMFQDLQEEMLKEAHMILLEQDRKVQRTGIYDAEQLSIAYHLLISSVYANPSQTRPWLEQLTFEISKNSWIIGRFITRGLHLLKDERIRAEYKEWLKRICHKQNDPESKMFACYIACYYGGVNEENTKLFLQSGGKLCISNIRVEQVIKESYINITEKWYKDSSNLLDINFLRMFLVLSQYPGVELRRESKNSLLIIYQKSLHSKDKDVIKRAEELLFRLMKKDK